MFQVKGWVSEQLNVNSLIKQIHLDYLGLRDIKQVPSQQCCLPELTHRVSSTSRRALFRALLRERLLLATGCRSLLWHSSAGLCSHLESLTAVQVFASGSKGKHCAWWVPAWCWGKGQGWLQFLRLLQRCARQGQQPLHSSFHLYLLLRWFNKTLNERW